MTSPVARRQPVQRRQPASWIEETIQRYLGEQKNKFRRPVPRGFDVEREPFDPSDYYGELGTIGQMSRQATRDYTQRLQAQRAAAQEAHSGRPQATIGGSASEAVDNNQGRFSGPLQNYRVTSGYGHRKRPTAGATTNHSGIDLAAPTGTPIYATHSGYVTNAGWSDGYGYNVTLNAGNGVESFYGHNSRNTVKPGQKVQKGQLIGYVGNTGVSTGPHLHYGVKVNGQWVNPSGYM